MAQRGRVVRRGAALSFAGLGPLFWTVGLLGKAAEEGDAQTEDGDAVEDEDEGVMTSLFKIKMMASAFKMLELVSETTPQATLQGYVAVSYGMLDPASEYFSPTFAASLTVSMCTAAAALLGVDTALLANDEPSK